MGGGLMQLVAYGAQDIYLTGNPQITFFKIVYRRHTNFAIETVEHTFVGNIGFGANLSAKISRNGDLVNKMYLRIILGAVDLSVTNSKFAWIRRVGHAIINQVEIDIGGTKIDRQYGTWLDIWYELSRKEEQESGYTKLIGDVPELTNYDTVNKEQYELFIPLQFWFNKFVGLSIPLIALQYHETTLLVNFAPIEELVITDGTLDLTTIALVDATLLVNYVFLDTEERRRFAIVGHEYLVEQIQFNGIESVLISDSNYVMDFNHPVKEIIWAMRNGNYSSGQRFVYYSNADNWNLQDASTTILEKSISVGVNPTSVVGGTWIEIIPSTIQTVGLLNITNRSTTRSVFVNNNSLVIGTYGITNKIAADIVINADLTITYNNVDTTITIRDLSIPSASMTDTRYNVADPIVRMFSNYGLLIDGSENPVQTARITFNGHNRFDDREGMYFNYVQPLQNHSNTPKDGINVYSFALYPEEHQPSGTSNFSRIESSRLLVTFNDSTLNNGLPSINLFNADNQFFIYAINYNILRVFAGLSGMAYVA